MRRRGRVDEFVSTDPGDEAHDAAVEQWRARLSGPINVVGNSQALLDTNYGAQIDARPTIRFNSAQIVKPVAQGTRWDFVATTNKNTLAFYNETPPQFHTLLFTPYYDRYLEYLEEKHFDAEVLIYPMRWAVELMATLKARPTTGALILYGLDKLDNDTVGIFGFDWKVTPTFYDANRKRDPHNHFGERALFRKVMERRGWSLND